MTYANANGRHIRKHGADAPHRYRVLRIFGARVSTNDRDDISRTYARETPCICPWNIPNRCCFELENLDLLGNVIEKLLRYGRTLNNDDQREKLRIVYTFRIESRRNFSMYVIDEVRV